MTTTTKTAGFNLFAAMAAVDLSSLPPSGDQLTAVLDGEIVIGTMSEDLVRIYRVILGVANSIDALKVKAREMDDAHARLHQKVGMNGKNHDGLDCREHAEKLDALEQEAGPLMAQLKHLGNIFWGLIHLEFPDVEDSSAAVREGNQIVLCPTSKNDSVPLELESFLAALEGIAGRSRM